MRHHGLVCSGYALSVLVGCLFLLGCSGPAAAPPNLLVTAPALDLSPPAEIPRPSTTTADASAPSTVAIALPVPPVAPALLVDALPTLDVRFASGSARLPKGHVTTLGYLVHWLSTHPQATVRLEGYGDGRGSTRNDHLLADRRARAVRNYLVRAKIPRNRITLVQPRPTLVHTAAVEKGQGWMGRVHIVVHT
jgi:hypothetical protein